MSQENVEVVEAFVRAWNARDLDAARDLHGPDAVARPVDDGPEAGPYMGRVLLLFAHSASEGCADARTQALVAASAAKSAAACGSNAT